MCRTVLLAGAALVVGLGFNTAIPDAASEPIQLDAGMLQSIGVRAAGVPSPHAEAAVGAVPATRAGPSSSSGASSLAGGEGAAPIAAPPEPLSSAALAIIGPASAGADAPHPPSAGPSPAAVPAANDAATPPAAARLPAVLGSRELQGIAVTLHRPAMRLPSVAIPEVSAAPAAAAPSPAGQAGVAAPRATMPASRHRPVPSQEGEPAASTAAEAPISEEEAPIPADEAEAQLAPPAVAVLAAPPQPLSDAVLTRIGLRLGPVDTP